MKLLTNVTSEDARLIDAIVNRAVTLAKVVCDVDMDRLSLQMDLTACHRNGCPLHLQRLLDADNFNFSHDVFGIANNIDRETGQLGDLFSPRHGPWLMTQALEIT